MHVAFPISTSTTDPRSLLLVSRSCIYALHRHRHQLDSSKRCYVEEGDADNGLDETDIIANHMMCLTVVPKFMN